MNQASNIRQIHLQRQKKVWALPGVTVGMFSISIAYRNGCVPEATVLFVYVFLRFITFPSDWQFCTEQRVGICKDRKGTNAWHIFVGGRPRLYSPINYSVYDPNHGYNSLSWGERDDDLFFNLKPAVFAEESYNTNSSKACPVFFSLKRVISCSRRCYPTGWDNFPRASVECHWHGTKSGKSGFPHDWNAEYLDRYIQEW